VRNMGEVKLYYVWESAIAGVPTEYHKRLADRVVGALADLVPEDRVDEAVERIRYHRAQIDSIIEEDRGRSRVPNGG